MSQPKYVPAKTEEVFNYLKDCAAKMRTVNYDEVAKATGLDRRGIGKQLGYIRDVVCRQQGFPWLNALAVQKGKWRPAESFLPARVSMGKDEEWFWRGMVLQVFSFDWSRVPFVRPAAAAPPEDR